MMRIKIKYIIVSCLIVFASTQCSGTKGLADSGNTRAYDENFKTINSYFQQVIKHSSLLVDKIKGKGTERVFVVSKRSPYSEGYTRTDVGRVKIKALSPIKTIVTVENPEYPFGFPEFKKSDYQRIIFNGLDKRVKKENDNS